MAEVIMSENDIEGYVVRELHSTFKSCFGCIHYDHRMVRSGRHPEYRDACRHPQAALDYYGEFVRGIEEDLRDRRISGCGTPEWCPVGQRDGEV